MSSLEDYLFTKNTKWVLWGLGGLILAGLIFHAGVVVGSHRSAHYRDGDAGFKPPFAGGMTLPQGFIRGGYGTAGTIESVSLPTITIRTRDGATELVTVGTSTILSGAGMSPLTPASLTPGEFVVIISDPGDTDNNETDARFIHVLPGPLASTSPMH